MADCQMSQWRCGALSPQNKVITPQIQGMLDVILEVAKKPFLSRISQKSTGALSRACAFLYCHVISTA